MDHVFVGLPDDYSKTYLYERHLSSTGKLITVKQVLWGDFLYVDNAHPYDANSEWTMIVWHPNNPEKRREYRVKTAHVARKRPLEIIFVDVGQGDGSILITPERDENERIIVIDAGEKDHMLEFLGKRFGGYRKGLVFHAAVITHPDKDHYLGFERIFSHPLVHFENIYHNGLVERPGLSGFAQLGAMEADPVSGIDYLVDLATDHAAIEQIYGAPVVIAEGRNEKLFPQVIRGALDNGRFTREDNTQGSVQFSMLSTKHGEIDADSNSWMPGFGPDSGRDYKIQILGPVVEPDDQGNPRLRKISAYGKTKNGHSVLLKLTYGSFRILFGGDLNEPAEKFLLKHYSGFSRWPRKQEDRDAMVAAANDVFESDVMKVCHHGAADVTDEFLAAVNPAAFVISSGDAEGHVHPRPDLLGRLGRMGRGDSPVLLSTELQRSTREKEDEKLVTKLKDDIAKQLSSVTETRSRRIEDAIGILGGSNVLVDGAIYVKTDGQRLIAAFRTETGSEKKKWFYFAYEMKDGELVLAKS